MSRSDVLVLPSLSEGMPVVGVRALGHGLAILGSDIGGMADIVRDGENGFLCRVNESDAFESALRTMLTSDDLLRRMKSRSRQLAHKFDLQAIVTRYEGLFEAVAK